MLRGLAQKDLFAPHKNEAKKPATRDLIGLQTYKYEIREYEKLHNTEGKHKKHESGFRKSLKIRLVKKSLL
mgnify:CR=1 FL=1|jgi:hypothetical protein